jgi:5'-nucleotidase
MKILISNDDGITARGLQVLAERLSREPGLSIYVVAPDRERSATGHSLTLHKPLRVEDVSLPFPVKGAWSTSGTPSDCVKFAVDILLPEPPALVLSGINSGPNLGTEVLYSGTVSAAMEGAIMNIPSVAVSLAGSGERHYETAAEFMAQLIKVLPEANLPPHCLLNVNVPNCKPKDLAGLAVTELGLRYYTDHYEKRLDPRGNVYYWLAGELSEQTESPTSDAHAIKQGFVSITPLKFNLTNHSLIPQLEQWAQLKGLIQEPCPSEPFLKHLNSTLHPRQD